MQPVDEAWPVMRTARIEEVAAPGGERGGAGGAEQGRQPARHVAADHVAVPGVGGPARHELGKDRRAAGKTALQGVFEVEQAKIIFPPLADDHLRFAFLRSEEHTSELQSLMRISYAVFCLTKQIQTYHT